MIAVIGNTGITRTADALIAIGVRCCGTLSETAFAFISGKPVAGIGTWQLTPPGSESVPIVDCASATEAVGYCERTAARG